MATDTQQPPTDAKVADVVAPPAAPTKAQQIERALQRVEALPVSVHEHAAVPANLDEQMRMAKWAVESGLLPSAIDTAPKAWMVMQRGGELGFPGMTAFEFLYVVNNQVRLKPAGAKAKALASGLLTDFREELVGQGVERQAIVTIKRRGISTPIVATFSMSDAVTAKLAGRGAWVTYPDRMLLARARGFAFSDSFADIIGGLQVREDFDLDPGESLGPAAPPTPPAPKAPPKGGFGLLRNAMAGKGPDATSSEGAPSVGDGPIVSAPASGGVAAAGRLLVQPTKAELEAPRPPVSTAGCDGNHAAPECASPGCWRKEEAPTSAVELPAPWPDAAPAPSTASVAPSGGEESGREDSDKPALSEGHGSEASVSSRGCDHKPALDWKARNNKPDGVKVVCEGCALTVALMKSGPVVIDGPPPSKPRAATSRVARGPLFPE